MKTAEQVKNDALRAEINELLPLLTEPQLSLLNRIHDNAPWKGWPNCPDNKLPDTYNLVQRSLSF